MNTKNKILISLAAIVGLSISAMAGTTLPRLVERNAPEYSTFARTNHLEGTVVVELVVTEQGTVVAADVVESVHSELDKAALDSVMTWKFTPATKDGVAIKQVVRVPITFDLVSPEHGDIDPSDTSNIAGK